MLFCLLDREAVRRYEELSEIFSDKDNYSQSRELLKEVSFCQKGKNKTTTIMEMCDTVFSKLVGLITGNQAE